MVVQVSTRVDKETKQQFDKVCEGIGVSPSNALSMLIKGVVNYNGIPFSVTTANVTMAREMPSATVLREANPSLGYGSKPRKLSRKEVFGCARGQFNIPDDFNAPMEDFKEYMDNEVAP
ncbi:MAG: type II toxin-antitoxin system RelB/DinJ family antitoxin [Kiritimatiellaeota bacterium]|nr:type II toxin-antitoxin system RelB/DinJ family antitoxin [Kiritimatiellota bacterium]